MGVKFLFLLLSSIIAGLHCQIENRFGIIINAGTCSQVFVYSWQQRISYDQIAKPSLLYMGPSHCPGMIDIWNKDSMFLLHVSTLVKDAIVALISSQSDSNQIPIYIRGNGDARGLLLAIQIQLLTKIRTAFLNTSISPFYFEPSFARILSGFVIVAYDIYNSALLMYAFVLTREEEAAYGWISSNSWRDESLPGFQWKLLNFVNVSSIGVVDVGTTSTQLAFEPVNKDNILESKYNLQIGNRRWELYAKSFQGFGYYTSRIRYTQHIANKAITALDPGSADVPFSIDYCFPSGSIQYLHGTINPNITVLLYGPAVPAQDQFERCVASLNVLLSQYEPPAGNGSVYCSDFYQGQCSINGAFQPNLTHPIYGFNYPILVSSAFNIAWRILSLDTFSNLNAYRYQAEKICALSYMDTITFELNSLFNFDPILANQPQNYCFIVSYMYALLYHGYQISPEQMLVNWNSYDELSFAPWIEGVILYEANNLPIQYSPNQNDTSHLLILAVIGFILSIILLIKLYKCCCIRSVDHVVNTSVNAYHRTLPPIRDADRTQRWHTVSDLNPFGTRKYNYESISDSQETLVATH